MNLKLDVVRLTNEDVIATSCGNLGASWTSDSFEAVDSYKLENGIVTNFNHLDAIGDLGNGVYNYLNGEPNSNPSGEILDLGKYYHYNTDIQGVFRTKFVECTHEEHHSTN